MNKCFFTAVRVTKDPDVSYSQGGTAFAKFSIAINRDYKVQEGQPTADFVNCVAFGKTAEFVEKYIHKASKLNVEAHVQTGSYTNKEGQRVYTTDFIVEKLEFCNDKSSEEKASEEKTDSETKDFMNIPDSIEEELPFN